MAEGPNEASRYLRYPNLVPSVLIPDTIVFLNSSPVVWYFTLGETVKMRSKSKLNSENIKSYFLSRPSRCGAVALWIKEDESGHVYEYLDAMGLENLFKTEGNIK